MLQVPAHNDNEQLRLAIRSCIAKHYRNKILPKSSVIKDIEDYLLPSIVYDFYAQKLSNFNLYLEDIDFSNSYWEFILERIAQYLSIYEKYDEKTETKFLGDIHPGEVSKYLFGEKIKYRNYPDYSSLLSSLALVILPDYEEYFPRIKKEKNVFVRDYVPVNIETKDPETVSQYYLNLGRIIPLLLLLRAIDINAENMIINLPYPVFFDMESIFSGEFSNDLRDYDIKNSGVVKINAENDSSILTGGLVQRDSLLKPLICGTSQKPYIGWRTKSKGKYYNIPILGGAKVKPSDYLQDLEKGFIQTAKKIISEKDNIAQILKEQEGNIRVIIRPTRMYRLMILKSCYPQIYTQQDIHTFLRNSLEGYGYIYKFENCDLLENEIVAMQNLQVPVFYSNLKAKKIFTPMDDVVAMWNKTPYEIWNKYAQSLNGSFFDEQLKIVRESIV